MLSGEVAQDRTGKIPSHKHSERVTSLAAQYLTAFVFLISSSILFAWLFEWDRYHVVTGYKVYGLSMLDKALVFWLLVAKSLAWFVPVLLICAFFVVCGLRRTALLTINCFWTGIFYFMAADLVSVSFQGYHAWDYVPPLRDIHWPWIAEQLTADALMIFGVFLISAPACFVFAERMTMRVGSLFPWVRSLEAASMLTTSFILMVVGVVPAAVFFNDRTMPGRIFSAIALPAELRESLPRLTDELVARVRSTEPRALTATFSAVGNSEAAGVMQQKEPAAYAFPRTMDFLGTPMNQSLGSAPLMAGSLTSGNRESFSRLGRVESRGLFPAASCEKSPLLHSIERDADYWSIHLALRHPDLSQPQNSGSLVEPKDELLARKLVDEAVHPGPADFSAFVERSDLPNVILIIFESFRPSALGPELMGELDAWSRQGLRLDRHFSGCNASHLGLFSLFYARSSLGYSQNLDRKIPPQFFESFRRSGYEITLLTSGEIKAHRRLGEFINESTCDNILMEGQFNGSAMDCWPDSDRRKLARLESILSAPQDRPQLVFFYLLSSHYRYPFPPEFEVFKESSGFWQFFDPEEQRQSFLNRYANSLLFLEHELMKVLRSIDLKRNIVVITGDHGESMGEDGVFAHGSRMSEIQVRVPCVVVGAGVEPRKIPTATMHADLLPTLLHVLAKKRVPIDNCQGRDLIADSSPADEVVLAPANGPDWEGLMIVRGNKRLVFKTDTFAETPWLEFTGLVDAAGQYEWKAQGAGRVIHVPR